MKRLFRGAGLVAILSLSLVCASPVAARASANILLPPGPWILITLKCDGHPETTRIAATTGSFTVLSVGSIYRPLSSEPFPVNKTLNARQVITYETGPTAVNNVLTHRNIYDHTHLDGVRVKTTMGTRVQHC